MPTAADHREQRVRTPVAEETLPSPSAPARILEGGAQAMFPLGLLSAGEQAEIAHLKAEPDRVGSCRAEELGLRIGKTVEMLTNGGGGPLLLKVDESRLALDRRVAMTIQVRRQR